MQERKFSEMENLGSFCCKRTNLTDLGSVFIMKDVGKAGCSITECSGTFVSEPVRRQFMGPLPDKDVTQITEVP